MINASEEVLSVAAHRNRPRPATLIAPRAAKSNVPAAKKSLPVERVFSDAKVSPFDQIEWERRTAEINDDAGKVIFKQENVEGPKSGSQLATKGGGAKNFYGEQGPPGREPW